MLGVGCEGEQGPLLHLSLLALGNTPMPQLTLTDEEAGTLRRVLEEYVSDLRMEIADTDSMDFRDQLKREEAFLKKLIEQLGTDRG